VATFDTAVGQAFNISFGYGLLYSDGDWTIWVSDLLAPHVLSPTPADLAAAKAAAVAWLSGNSVYRISDWNDQGGSATALFVKGSD
jgi:hypothetical protein